MAKAKAKAIDAEYERLNFRDDQFDMSYAFLSIAVRSRRRQSTRAFCSSKSESTCSCRVLRSLTRSQAPLQQQFLLGATRLCKTPSLSALASSAELRPCATENPGCVRMSKSLPNVVLSDPTPGV